MLVLENLLKSKKKCKTSSVNKKGMLYKFDVTLDNTL